MKPVEIQKETRISDYLEISEIRDFCIPNIFILQKKQPFCSKMHFYPVTLRVIMTAKILHIVLSLAVFFSTTGFTLGHHYCQNTSAGVAVFGISGGCQKDTHRACNAGGHCSAKKEGDSGCCHNESEYFQQELPKQSQFSGFDLLKKTALVAVLPVVFNFQLPATEAHLPTYQNYKPPIVCDDFQSMLQTFLL